MSKVRWGILSTAKIAVTKVIPGMQKGVWSEVTAIASRDRGKAEDAARTLGIARSYGSYEELLADPQIEAIYNPLPNQLHVPWSIKAAEAGKHVLCEKPLSLTVAEARKLLGSAGPHGSEDRRGLHGSHPPAVAARTRVGRFGPDWPTAFRLGFLQLFQQRPIEHPQHTRIWWGRADGHRMLPDHHVAVHVRRRAFMRVGIGGERPTHEG